jgi:hypothetical protein
VGSGVERIAAALQRLSTRSLAALRYAAERAPQTVPGLLAWLEAASGWEIDRRNGHRYRLAAPMEAIPPEESAQSVAALMVIGAAISGAAGLEPGEASAIVEFMQAALAMVTDSAESLPRLH